MGLTLWEAEPGHSYRVGTILFGLVRDAFWDIGIREGSRLDVTARNTDTVDVIVDGDRSERVRLEYGVFVPLVEADRP